MNNSDTLYQLSKKYFIPNTVYETCPKDIPLHLLKNELMCVDLETSGKSDDIDYLWRHYYYIHNSSTNVFGFTFLEKENKNPIVLNKKTKLQTKVRNTKKQYKTKLKNQTRKNKRITTYFNNIGIKQFGGGDYATNKAQYISDVNSTTQITIENTVVNFDNSYIPLLPLWRHNSSGTRYFHTISYIDDIYDRPDEDNDADLSESDEHITLYLHGTSLPAQNTRSGYLIRDSNFCTNTFAYYRYILNVKRVISFQGCDLDWTNIRGVRPPSYCHGLNEKKCWEELAIYNEEAGQVEYKEYYWVDMTPGYFETYYDLALMDFTNKENISIMHCLAGFGRTGTAILFIIFKYFLTLPKIKEHYKDDISRNHPGDTFTVSEKIIYYMKGIIQDGLQLKFSDPDSPDFTPSIKYAIDTTINMFNLNAMKYELFDMFYSVERGVVRNISYSLLNVLIGRINYILYFSACSVGFDKVELFPRLTNRQYNIFAGRFDPDRPYMNILTNPITVDTSPLSTPISDMISNFTIPLHDVMEQTPFITRPQPQPQPQPQQPTTNTSDIFRSVPSI